MSIEITDSNGRNFRSFADAVASDAKGILDDARNEIERAIRSQECPVHHEVPSVRRRQVGSKTEFRINVCCEYAAANAQTAADRALRS